jgi:hypothetical protein
VTRESTAIILDAASAVGKAAELHAAIIHVPQPVSDRFEADGLFGQDVADIHPGLPPADAAVAAHFPQLEVAWVLERLDRAAVRPGRGAIERRRGLHAETLVRALGVELLAEGVEAALLGALIGPGRPSGGGLERPMHALVSGILLRVAGLDELGVNAAPEEPHAELGEPGQRAAGKRRAIVGADPLGQAVVLEEPGEHRTHEHPCRLQEPLTAEQVAAEVVGHGERVAVAAIAGAEVALEVDRPERIGRAGNRAATAGMGERAPAPAAADQAAAGEPEAGGARRGPRGRWRPLPEEPAELLRAPRGVAPPDRHQLVNQRGRRLVGRVMRRRECSARPARPSRR